MSVIEKGVPHPVRQKVLTALPNMVTILALWAGLSGLTYAIDGDSSRAVICVFIAALLDACDGRVARMTGTSSRFGAELDSLSDVVCFGAVPAFILYSWGLDHFGMAGWMICLLLASASALRLARFNVAADASDKPLWTKGFFTGIPAPGGAFLGLLPVYLANAGIMEQEQAVVLACFSVPLTASLMVSTVPTFSGKTMGRMAALRWLLPSIIAFGTFLALMVINAWLALVVLALCYLLTLPLSMWRHERLRRRTA
jgi:CDP-diacylglycerol---serine O-phosphatidyltransferase